MKIFTKIWRVAPATLAGEIVTRNGDTCWKVYMLVARAKSVKALSTLRADRVVRTVWQCAKPVSTDWVETSSQD